jgi:hypothetical protein
MTPMVFRLLFEQEAEKAAAAKAAEKAAAKPATPVDPASADIAPSSDTTGRDTPPARKSPANE